MIYPYTCENESCSQVGKALDISKSIQDSSRREECGDCGQDLRRVYSFARTPQFQPFFDELYKQEISCNSQMNRLMKQHGHIPAQDILRQKFNPQVKHAKWKAKKSHSVRFGASA